MARLYADLGAGIAFCYLRYLNPILPGELIVLKDWIDGGSHYALFDTVEGSLSVI